MNAIKIKRNLTANTDRGPSNAIWGDCPWETYRNDSAQGMIFEDDFTVVGNATMSSAYAGSIGQWSTYGYAGAQLNDGAKEGGVIKLSSDGDNEGLTLLSSAGTYRFVTTSTLALNRKMWFEARIAKSSIVTAHLTCFVGLMSPTLSSGLPVLAQPLLSATDDALSTACDSFGFILSGTTSTRGGPTEVGAGFNLTSGTVNYPTNCTAMMAGTGQTVLAADTYVKVGWIFDPAGPYRQIVNATARQTAGQVRRALIRFFINGLEHTTFLTSDDVANATATQAFPTAFMCPVISMMNMASQSSDYMACDWIKIAQEALT